MSTPTPTTADTLIVLKINHNGQMCRFKLPLRDMISTVLEPKIKSRLNISPQTECILQRYSDSASKFVSLDPADVGVYKQLYRAAKAKQRLKIKVITGHVPEGVSRKTPQADGDSLVVSASRSADETTGDISSREAPHEAAEKADESVSSQDGPGVLRAEMPIRPARVPKPAAVEDEMEPQIAVSESGKVKDAAKANMSQKSDAGILGGRTELSAHPSPGTTLLEPKPCSSFRADLPQPCGALSSVSATLHQAQEPDQGLGPAHSDSAGTRPVLSVTCDSCNSRVPEGESHYHCQSCAQGDFDLCNHCVDVGITCLDTSHWLVKRNLVDGRIVASLTTTVSPKPKAEPSASLTAFDYAPPARCLGGTSPAACSSTRMFTAPSLSQLCSSEAADAAIRGSPLALPVMSAQRGEVRICNNCLVKAPGCQLVHCVECDDFDLCEACFSRNKHGHDPSHAFELAVQGNKSGGTVSTLLAPGRNVRHLAFCDGCDKAIRGVRHKCLDCPDWDYCSSCFMDAGSTHAGHRFAPVFRPLKPVSSEVAHHGVSCDGPLCVSRRHRDIVGVRYKCTVCHNTDFCGNCESSPTQPHNRTHPLIKLKTPVRHVSVTTTADKLTTMGDWSGSGSGAAGANASNRANATVAANATAAATPEDGLHRSTIPVQTLFDLQPKESKTTGRKDDDSEAVKQSPDADAMDTNGMMGSGGSAVLSALKPTPVLCVDGSRRVDERPEAYLRDSITFGTQLGPSRVFQQTWILVNSGRATWPSPTSVKFVGGDYMGLVDLSNPTSVRELQASNETSVCHQPLKSGGECAFVVLLRTPPRPGRYKSYWRLSDVNGNRFGPRLWCCVTVREPVAAERAGGEVEGDGVGGRSVIDAGPEPQHAEDGQAGGGDAALPRSPTEMIFPKLEKESSTACAETEAPEVPGTKPAKDLNKAGNNEENSGADEYEDEEGWAEDSESVITDDEYEVIDAVNEGYRV